MEDSTIGKDLISKGQDKVSKLSCSCIKQLTKEDFEELCEGEKQEVGQISYYDDEEQEEQQEANKIEEGSSEKKNKLNSQQKADQRKMLFHIGQYPYCSLGLIVTYAKIQSKLQNNQQQQSQTSPFDRTQPQKQSPHQSQQFVEKQFGTAFLISYFHIMTAAHNLFYQIQSKEKAKNGLTEDKKIKYKQTKSQIQKSKHGQEKNKQKQKQKKNIQQKQKGHSEEQKLKKKKEIKQTNEKETEMIKGQKFVFYSEPLFLKNQKNRQKMIQQLHHGIEAEIVWSDKRYETASFKQRKYYDWAILELKFKSKQQKQAFGTNFASRISLSKLTPLIGTNSIEIAGYPHKMDFGKKGDKIKIRRENFYQYALHSDKNYASDIFQQNFVLYEHSTTQGTSGAPLLMTNNHQSIVAIGMHIRKKDDGKGLGILFSSIPVQLQKKVRQCIKYDRQFTQNISQLQSYQLIIDSSKKIQSLAQDSTILNYLLSIKFSYIPATEEQFERFSQIFCRNLRVKRIQFDQKIITQNFQQQIIPFMPKMINHCFHLQQIILNSNSINDDALRQILKIQRSHILRTIELHNNKLTDQGLRLIVDNFSLFFNLSEIGLNKNEISDIGVKILAERCGFFSLGKIYLGDNKITDKGLQALMDNSDKFLMLQEINLNGNMITGQQLRDDFEIKGVFYMLNKISFNRNHLKDKGFMAFLRYSSKFPKLRNFHIQGNRLTIEGVRFLIENINKFPKVQKVYLGNNQITKEELRIFAQEYEFKFQCWEAYHKTIQIVDSGLWAMQKQNNDSLDPISISLYIKKSLLK